MKKLFFLLVLSCVVKLVSAQQANYILDQEQLFKPFEIKTIDSLLAAHFDKDSTMVNVLTSELMPNDSLTRQFDQLMDSAFRYYANDQLSILLFLSRKNQQLLLTCGTALRRFCSNETLMEILNTGIPLIKEKKLAEAVIVICEKSMEFMNGIKANPSK